MAAHPDRLVVLRRLAEEWDFDLALDLCGPIDPTWESEAAISKLMPRLTLVRIGPTESRPPDRATATSTIGSSGEPVARKRMASSSARRDLTRACRLNCAFMQMISPSISSLLE